MQLTLVHNPNAGEEPTSADAVCAPIRDLGHDVTYHSTEEPGWEEALGRPADVVVIAGGDGTVHDVVIEVAGRNVPVALVPLGTANNVARALGLPHGDLDESVRRWHEARDRPRARFDVPHFAVRNGQARFVESFGGGLFAQLLIEADQRHAEDGPPDAMRSAVDLLSSLVDDAAPEAWSIWVDGDDLSGDFVAVEVMNIGDVGPRLALSPEASPSDGLLDLVLVSEDDRVALREHVAARRLDPETDGVAADLPAVGTVRRCRVVQLDPPSGAALHADDRSWLARHDGTTPNDSWIEVQIGDQPVEVLGAKTG